MVPLDHDQLHTIGQGVFLDRDLLCEAGDNAGESECKTKYSTEGLAEVSFCYNFIFHG